MIDMHIHTKYSDGTYTVKEVLQKAEELGLKYISITDHDNCKAYNEFQNINVKEYFSGEVIRGIELKCLYNSRLIEILGYNYDKEKLENWLNEFYKNRQRKDTQMKYFNILYDACVEIGLKMNPKENIKWNPENDWASVTVYYELKSHEENKEKIPEDFWNDFTTFTKKYCADLNSPFYIDKSDDYPTLNDAIKAVKDAGGKVIVAHAFIYKWAKDKENFIKDLHQNYDIDGFECYHSSFSEEQIEYISNYCKENKLLMSGGSDCHGDNKPGINLAVGKGNLKIDERIIENWINIRKRRFLVISAI